ncbi:hypothetical protein BDV12DRAFT_189140 [Aspergillus spectabilis]
MTETHYAAILPQKGGPLSAERRLTPEPGPNEVLIEVKAVALSPVDYHQHDFGMPPVPVYPAVLGSDTTGLIAKVGCNVTTAPAPGSRVIAFAASFYQNGSPDNARSVIALPEDLSFEEGAVFPFAVMTALTAWTTIGKQALLVWGGASSVGTFAIQSAKSLGFTVYATASSRHHDYLKKLGAHAVFDYKASDVISQIVQAVEEDGVKLHTAHCVVDGGLQPTLDVLKEPKGETAAKIVHAPIVFNFPPMELTERNKHIYQCFHGWLQDGLKSGSVVPSPALQVEGGGLNGLNPALDKLKAGVSAAKIVLSI